MKNIPLTKYEFKTYFIVKNIKTKYFRYCY